MAIKKMLAVMLAAAITAGILGGMAYARRSRQRTMTVDERVDAIYQSATQEEQKVIEHKAQTVERVTVIREAVREEVAELGPDGLVEFALNEINIYRGGYK